MDPILKILINILPNQPGGTALHEPEFSGNEWKYVKDCLDSGWVSSAGKYVEQFEQKLIEFTGAKYAIATVNGTAAMHIAYLLAGVKPLDEVLVPSLTFVGTINPIRYCGAIPHFIDSEDRHLGIDVQKLENYLRDILVLKNGISFNKLTERPIRVLCVMHTLGHPVDLDPINQICEKYNLKLIEDAAEALGSYYKNVHAGTYGFAGILSFNGNKTITTGGGGALLTNNQALANLAKHLTTTAKLPHVFAFTHDQVGYNYRMPNINAALGVAQLEKIVDILSNKRKLAEIYKKYFCKLPNIKFISEPNFARSNYWLNAILLNNQNEKNNLIELLIKNKIMVRPLWDLQHTLEMNQDCPRMSMVNAENLFDKLIKLPSSPQLVRQTCAA